MNKTKIGIELIFLMGIIFLIPLLSADECVGGTCGTDINLTITSPRILVYQETADIIQASTTEQWINISYLKPIGANPFSMWGSHDFGIGAEWSNTSFNSNTFNRQCWNNNLTYVNLRFTSYSSPRTTTLQCWNGTTWGTMYSDSQGGGWNDGFDTINIINAYDGDQLTYNHWDTAGGFTQAWRTRNVDNSGFYEEFMWWDVTPATPPNISIIYPINTTYIVNLTNFNYYYYDTNPERCWYSKNNGITNSTSVNAGTNFTGMTSVEGSNTWRLYCNDTYESVSSSSITFIVDKTSPSAQSGGAGGTSPSNRSYTPTSPTNFTVNASDSGSGIENITFTLKNNTGDIINETTISGGGVLNIFFGFMYDLWYEGVYKWFFTVVDTVGNIFTSEESSLTYDATAPSGAIIYPLNTTYDHQITSMNVSITEANPNNCWYDVGAGNVTLPISYKLKSANPILIDAYEYPDNSITYMNDSNLSTYSFWNGTGGGLATRLNLSYKIDYDRVSNARWIFDYYPVGIYVDAGYCTNGYFCYWDWSDNTWKDLTYGCSPVGCYNSHFVKNISLPNNAVNNIGEVKIMSPLMYSGIGGNMSVYESYITYNQICGSNITGLASSEGSNIWKFWINDSVGFVNESEIMFVQDTGKSLVTIHSPTTTYYNYTEILVNLSATDSVTPINLIWWNDNGGVNITYTSPVIVNFTEGTHNFRMYANDSVNNVNTTNVNFVIDTTNPLINLSPISNFSRDVLPSYFNINYTINDTNINTCWYSLGEGDNIFTTAPFNNNLTSYQNASGLDYKNISVNHYSANTIDLVRYTNISKTQEIGGANQNINSSIIFTLNSPYFAENVTLSLYNSYTYSPYSQNEASHKYSFYIYNFNTDLWEVFNNTAITKNSTCSDGGCWIEQCDINIINNTLKLDYISGDIIKIKYDIYVNDNQAGVWGQYSYGMVCDGETLGNSGFHRFVNLYASLYDNLNRSGSLSCSGTSASIPIETDGYNTITIFGKDVLNFISSNSKTFYLLLHSYGQSVPVNITTEGSVLDFTLDVSMTDFHDTTAYLVYNGVDYPADSFNEVGNSVSFLKTITIPNGVGSIAGNNVTWYWRYFVEGNSWLVDNFTTTPQTQLVYSVEIDDCSLYNDTILHFDLNDEALDTLMNISLNPLVDADVQIVSLGDESVYWQFNETWNARTGSICIPYGLLNISSYRFNGVLSYLADTYVQEFWYIDNGLLQDNVFAFDNFTNRNITLRDLPLIDSSTFLFKYYNEKFLTQPNSIVTILRYYIGEGVYKEVERCKLDNNGECHLHLVEEDVIYKFRISTDGIEDYLSGDYNAKCVETPCSITLQKDITTGEWDTTHDNLAEGTYHIKTDKEGRNVTLSFNLNETGIMQLDVFKYSNVINSPDTLVVTDSITAKTGEISVVVPLSYGNQTYYAVVRHNTGFVSSVWIDLNEDGYKYFGALGLFLGALLVLSLGLISVSSGGWTIAFLILGLIIASATKLFDMDVYLIMFIISAGGLVIWRLASRRSL